MAAPSFAFQLLGIAELKLFFGLLTKAAQDFGDAWVGSAVEYGPFNEFGTEVMEERPHWRVVIPQLAQEMGASQSAQNAILDAMAGFGEGADPSGSSIITVQAHGGAPLFIALQIERRVKQMITALSIIDTGNYRASVATGKTEEEAFANSSARAFIAEDF